jgi:5-formyltetrahydrofolate cyclo-ligase
MDKLKRRSQMKETLSLIDEVYRTEMSSLISKNLFQLFSELNVIQQKICIGAFSPIAKEPLMNILQNEEIGKLTSFPAFDSETGMMIFRKARIQDLVSKTDFGPKISGPDESASEVVPGLILIPGIAFSATGDRLGRGKGFYDKYLGKPKFKGVKIGICFSIQLVDSIPTEEHDVALDYIVTEKEIIKCKYA